MMLDAFVNKMGGFKAFLQKSADEILLKESDMVADLNRERMYNEGKGADDVTFGEYRPFTVFLKKMNLPGHDSKTENITLKDTGKFYEGIVLKEKSLNTIEITSTSDSAVMINSKPQFRDALGLTKTEADKVGEVIADKLVNEIVNYFK